MPESINENWADTGVTFDMDELLAAIRHDCVTFFSFYLGEQLTMEVPELHQDIWAELLELLNQANLEGVGFELKKLFAVPRDFAKSTVAKLAVILFMRYSRLRFCLYVSKTNPHAKNAVRDIIMWLNSDQESILFGTAKTVKSSETESLWILKIGTRATASQEPVYKTVIFKALGADQQVRGLNIMNARPQFIVCDDIEDLDNTTPELQPKLDEWFMGPLLKAFDASGFVCIFIGNMIRKTTLLARLAKEADWNPTVFGALVRDKNTGELKSLWEDRHPKKKLLAQYAFQRRMGTGHMWEAEMMNLTQDEILHKDFEKAVRPPQPHPDDVLCGFLALDPAFGQKDHNDDSSITVHVRTKEFGIPIVAESLTGKFNEEELFEHMVMLSTKWGLTTWCIESGAAQSLLIPLFTLLLRDRKMNESLFVMLPLTSGGTAKASRILAFRSAVSQGSYGVADSEFDLIERLGEYSALSKKHDDLCDSAAYGIIGWQHYGTMVESMGVMQVAMLAFVRDGMYTSGIQTETQVTAF